MAPFFVLFATFWGSLSCKELIYGFAFNIAGGGLKFTALIASYAALIALAVTPNTALAVDNNNTRTIVGGPWFTAVDHSGRMFSHKDRTDTSASNTINVYPENGATSDLPSGLTRGFALFTDSTGKMFYTGTTNNTSSSSNALQEVKIPSGAKFAPNMVFNTSGVSTSSFDTGAILTDTTGKMYSFGYYSDQLQSWNQVSKPNTSVTCELTCLYTDSKGYLYSTGNGVYNGPGTRVDGISGLQPNQLFDSANYFGNPFFYYTDSKGSLKSAQLDSFQKVSYTNDTGITNMMAGKLFPVDSLIVSNKQGKTYSVYEEVVRELKGLSISPDMFATFSKEQTSSTLKPMSTWLTDNDGRLNYCTYIMCMKAPDIKFKPNQAGMGSYWYAYAQALDGTVYEARTAVSGPGVDIRATELTMGAVSTGDDTSKCVVQMPTTGAPQGLTFAGLAAVGVLLFGLCFSALRRKQ